MPVGKTETVAFDPADVRQRLTGSAAPEVTSVEYLLGYLTTLKAAACVVEGHYVDRHYLDDYVHYYARSFVPPSPHCERLHFFSRSRADIEDSLDRTYEDPADGGAAARIELEASYLGFVVKRPISSAPIGRTVLRTFPIDGRRHYEVVRPYRVDLAGIPLTVWGLAYQQQDGGAAVCASTALWSALQRVAFVSGYRTPTPSAITLASGSPFPASYGLTDLQMATALNNLGYLADTFAPAENRPLFRAKLTSCLDSQLPVVLLLGKRESTPTGDVAMAHAVTVTGYSAPVGPIDVPAPHGAGNGVQPVPMAGGAVEVLYVHDDNLGSHAHYELIDSTTRDEEGHPKLLLRRGRKQEQARCWWRPDVWDVQAALVPKPEKVRLSIDDLFWQILEFRRVFELELPGHPLHFGASFCPGVEYKHRLFHLGVDRAQLRSFLSRLPLPRQVGVVSFHSGSLHLCDALIDVSEVPRSPDLQPAVLGIVACGVPVRSIAWKNLASIAQRFNCGLIAAPSTLPP